MTTKYQRTAAWLAACGKQPHNPEQASTQLGCHLEEMREQLECLRVSQDGWAAVLDRLIIDLRYLSEAVKSGKITAHVPTHLRVGFLKELCDGKVTADGVGFLLGFDMDAADAAVLGSNDAKLVDGKPVLSPGGKIQKPAGWKAPNLKPYAKT